VPALYLCLNKDHASSASAFEQAGIGLSLGIASTTSDEAIVANVQGLLHDTQRRRDMRAAGLMTVDGQAPTRIAADLARLLGARRAALRTAL
jgi:spore coat polysaccharide biosynthesis protein SpsF